MKLGHFGLHRVGKHQGTAPMTPKQASDILDRLGIEPDDFSERMDAIVSCLCKKGQIVTPRKVAKRTLNALGIQYQDNAALMAAETMFKFYSGIVQADIDREQGIRRPLKSFRWAATRIGYQYQMES
jgi:hypothetical protein